MQQLWSCTSTTCEAGMASLKLLGIHTPLPVPSVQASGGLSKSQKKKAKAKAAAARKQAAAEAGEGSIEQNGSADAGSEGPVSSTATAGGADHASSRAHKLLAAGFGC